MTGIANQPTASCLYNNTVWLTGTVFKADVSEIKIEVR
jgi:hypothetical protein